MVQFAIHNSLQCALHIHRIYISVVFGHGICPRASSNGLLPLLVQPAAAAAASSSWWSSILFVAFIFLGCTNRNAHISAYSLADGDYSMKILCECNLFFGCVLIRLFLLFVHMCVCVCVQFTIQKNHWDSQARNHAKLLCTRTGIEKWICEYALRCVWIAFAISNQNEVISENDMQNKIFVVSVCVECASLFLHLSLFLCLAACIALHILIKADRFHSFFFWLLIIFVWLWFGSGSWLCCVWPFFMRILHNINTFTKVIWNGTNSEKYMPPKELVVQLVGECSFSSSE